MALDPVDLLLDELTRDGRWPPRRELRLHEQIATHRAFLESDRAALRIMAGWPRDRDYKVDPLAELMADAWADHLYGEELTIEPANERDANALAALLEGNGDITADLHEAERSIVGEGEQWWRIYRDEEVADYPLLEWHSRDVVVPLFVGGGAGRLIAAAVVTELEQHPRRRRAVYRHFEVHADGLVEHVLFRGTKTRIGETVPLGEHPELADLDDALSGTFPEPRQWAHGLPMLMGRIINGRRVDRRFRAGVSDYHRVQDFLLDLNEAATIGAENMRLTAKRRVVVSEDALRQPARGPDLIDRGDGVLDFADSKVRAGFDAGEDVLVVSRLDAELGQSPDSTFKVLEYSFDAEALITYKRDAVETAVTRVGLTPVYLGLRTGEGDGQAVSGTHLRLRLIPTTKAGQGKRRPHERALPHVLALMARLDALSGADGGFGRAWADPTTEPAVEFATSLPRDDVEDAQVEATLVGAGLRSRRTSIESQHPDWTPELVDEELDRIADERPATSAAAGLGLA